MPEPSDNGQTAPPAGAAAAVAPTGSAGSGQGQSVTPTPDNEAQITALNETMATMKADFTKQIGTQRSHHDRQMASMRRDMAPPPAPQQFVDAGQGQTEEQAMAAQINAKFASSDQARADLEYQTAVNTFKVDNSGWGEDWEAMQAILGDDAQVQNVAVYKQDGTVDYAKTLSYTRNIVQNSKYGAARAKADAERATLEAGRASRQAQAVISGTGGYAMPQDVTAEDVKGMTPQQMIDKGIYQTDPNDPPTFD